MTILAILVALTAAGIFAIPAMEMVDRVTERRRLRREDRADRREAERRTDDDSRRAARRADDELQRLAWTMEDDGAWIIEALRQGATITLLGEEYERPGRQQRR